MTHPGEIPRHRNRDRQGADTPAHPDVRRWLTAARDPTIAAILESIYSDLAAEVAARAPACWASGRCCNFEASGHRLYVTGLEAAYSLTRLDHSHPRLTAQSLAAALSRGGCPFQVSNLCGIHAIKPLACRLYFCDRTAQAWQHDLSERLHERIRQLHEMHAVPYRYAEWRSLLALFTPDPPPS